MKTYVPVKKIMKIVSTQRNLKHERRSSLQEPTGTRRRCRWNSWVILFCLLSALIYLYSHKAHYLLGMTGQIVTNEIPHDAPPHEKIKSTHHVTIKMKNSALPIPKPSTVVDTIDVTTTIKSTTKSTGNFYEMAILRKPGPEPLLKTQPAPDLPFCLRKKPYPKFKIKMKSVSLYQENIYPQVVKGGSYHPVDCKARFKVGIIVPYRNRKHNLGVFLYNIHLILMQQKLDYQIFVIEQEGTDLFNKGRVYNAGYQEMIKFNTFHCIVFHDVDLLPLNENILYNCPILPRHMCARVNDTALMKMDPTYQFQNLFGGVVSMTRDQFVRANGFSNLYFGWGGEDNDMFWRLRAAGYPIVRYNSTIGVYLVMPHKREQANPFSGEASIQLDSYRFPLEVRKINSTGIEKIIYKLVENA